MDPFRIKLLMEKLYRAADEMHAGLYREISRLHADVAVTPEPVPYSEREKLEYKRLEVGQTWSERLWDCAWFHITGDIPAGYTEQELALGVDIDGEGCLFDESGTPMRGVSSASASAFDNYPGKRYVPFADHHLPVDKVDIWMETGNNNLFGTFLGGKVRVLGVYACNLALYKLFYDYKFLLNLAESMSDREPLKMGILYALEKVAVNVTAISAPEKILAAQEVLRPYLERKGPEIPALTFYAVGHSHLDLAWLWPLRETRRKAGRTFSTALANIKAYPDYIYGASQPQQFAWIKQDYPKLYEKVKAAVAAGRIEVQGGMWVEADTNITGGESLVRQFYYGKKFWKDEFGKDVNTLWLPDVFGFSGALPQILRGCGCENFLTIKLSWNMVNKFPYHSFRWKGIDGSEVLVHMPPEGTYNSDASPKAVANAAAEYSERGLSECAMLLYGIGDGGGGPGTEHLEYIEREKDACGLPRVQSADSVKFFARLHEEADKLPEYTGEMYLEKHQGTYTSQSKNKRFNRLTEVALSETEFAYALKGVRNGYDKLDDIWKEMLLYQFHDIIPGSSIQRVYNETEPRYRAILETLRGEIENTLTKKGGTLCALNATSFGREEYIARGGKWYAVSAKPYALSAAVPAKGKGTCRAQGLKIENKNLLAEFDASGRLVRLYDKSNGRESVKGGNILRLYEDCFDAWDTYIGYIGSDASVLRAESAKEFNDGFAAGIEFVYTFGDSHIVQRASLTENARALRFDNRVEWKETKKMLRADFYPDVYADEATFDIQFGNLKRSMRENNSHEGAQFEVSAHKWVDMSERDFGVAILNDCKYGYRAKNGLISIDLLRSQMYPCVDQDKGEHDFAYAVFPHAGDVYAGGVAKEAYAMNHPLCLFEAEPTESLVSTDNEHAVIETVKPAYDGQGIIVRLYNDMPIPIRAKLSASGRKAMLCDMLENTAGKCGEELAFHPYEIKTLRLL